MFAGATLLVVRFAGAHATPPIPSAQPHSATRAKAEVDYSPPRTDDPATIVDYYERQVIEGIRDQARCTDDEHRLEQFDNSAVFHSRDAIIHIRQRMDSNFDDARNATLKLFKWIDHLKSALAVALSGASLTVDAVRRLILEPAKLRVQPGVIKSDPVEAECLKKHGDCGGLPFRDQDSCERQVLTKVPCLGTDVGQYFEWEYSDPMRNFRFDVATRAPSVPGSTYTVPRPIMSVDWSSWNVPAVDQLLSSEFIDAYRRWKSRAADDDQTRETHFGELPIHLVEECDLSKWNDSSRGEPVAFLRLSCAIQNPSDHPARATCRPLIYDSDATAIGRGNEEQLDVTPHGDDIFQADIYGFSEQAVGFVRLSCRSL